LKLTELGTSVGAGSHSSVAKTHDTLRRSAKSTDEGTTIL
jgi:hypothetical protein